MKIVVGQETERINRMRRICEIDLSYSTHACGDFGCVLALLTSPSPEVIRALFACPSRRSCTMRRDARRCSFASSGAFRLRISCSTTPSTDPAVPPDATSIPRRPTQPARPRSVAVRVRELEVRAAARAAALRASEASEQLVQESAKSSPAERAHSVEALTACISVLQKELRALRKLSDPRLDGEIENIENLNAQASDLLKHALLAQKKSAEKAAALDDASQNPSDSDASNSTSMNSKLSEAELKSNPQTPPDATPAVAEKIRASVARGGSELKRRAESVRTGFGTSVSTFVRDDGTIDLKVLREILSGRLDSAGTIWSRLNGRAEEELEQRTEDDSNIARTRNSFVPINTEKEQFRLRELISELERDLNNESKKREANLRKEDQLGKLIRAKEIRAMDDNVNAVRRTLAVRVLQLEMEKIFVALTEEFERGLISIGDEKNEPLFVITEFGELDSKLMDLSDYIDQNEPLLVADDTLGEVANDIQYFKTRLGLDATLYTSSTLDWLQVRQIFIVSMKKTRTGLEFYARGFRLFVGDLAYAGKLIKRVVWGYIPTPREVRTIRRTGRDILTLIPFTIILIAPLTPVGHVLVFSFIQRNWPEFFPSTFSERRQELMKRYESYAEAKRDDDDDTEDFDAGNDRKQKRRSGVMGRVVLVWRWIINADGTRRKSEETDKNGNGTKVKVDRAVSATDEPDKPDMPQRTVAVMGEKLAGGGSGNAGANGRIRKGDSKSLGIDDLHLAD